MKQSEKVLTKIQEINKLISTDVEERARKKDINRFEELTFYWMLDAAKNSAQSYLEVEELENAAFREDVDAIDNSYLLLISDELYTVLKLRDRDNQFRKIFNVSEEKFISDFANCFDNSGANGIEKFLKGQVEKYSEAGRSYNIDPRDQWFSQAVHFIDLIMDTGLNFSKKVEENEALKIKLSLISQSSKLLNVKFLRGIFKI